MAANDEIRGSVRNAQDGRGLEDIEIEVERIGAKAPKFRRSLNTGPQGKFKLDKLSGDYRVGLGNVPAKDKSGALWQPRSPDKGERNARVGKRSVDVASILLEPVTNSVSGTVLRVTDNTGVGGVEVVLRTTAPDGTLRDIGTATTDPNGGFQFSDVPAGTHVVSLERSPVNGLEPALGDPDEGRREFRVPADKNEQVRVQAILLEPERHRIFGTVRRGPGGPPVPFATIRVLDPQGDELAQLEADRNGFYEFRASEAGTFLLEVAKDGFRRIDTVVVASDHEHDVVGDAGVGTEVTSAPALQDFAAFPVLTESVMAPQAPAATGVPSSSVGQTVQAALREALSWRPKPGDPRGFAAALAQSFDRREVEGHTEAIWSPRSYATQVQADMGAITGAQASVYSRAKVALDAALPLLDGLYPLDPAADPQDTEAIRSIIRSELLELVTELGVEGGPRVSRIDDLLELLLRAPLPTGRGTTVIGQLELLADRFGLVQGRVENVAEEEDLTNLLILEDYVKEIDTSWQARRSFFDGTAKTPFLGTQLVLISRSLAVSAESVGEVRYTLDSVFLGAAEQLAIQLTFKPGDPYAPGSTLEDSKGGSIFVPANTPPILLGDLLSWVERVASEEGPRLLQDGGKDGATALIPILDRLRTLVRAALVTTGSGPNRGLQSPDSVPAGYATARVQRALAELAKYLDDTAVLTRPIGR